MGPSFMVFIQNPLFSTISQGFGLLAVAPKGFNSRAVNKGNNFVLGLLVKWRFRVHSALDYLLHVLVGMLWGPRIKVSPFSAVNQDVSNVFGGTGQKITDG